MTDLKNDGGPAFPHDEIHDSTGNPPYRHLRASQGMSVRAYAAIAVMQGFAAEPNTDGDPALIASVAVKWADALIAELAK